MPHSPPIPQSPAQLLRQLYTPLESPFPRAPKASPISMTSPPRTPMRPRSIPLCRGISSADPSCGPVEPLLLNGLGGVATSQGLMRAADPSLCLIFPYSVRGNFEAFPVDRCSPANILPKIYLTHRLKPASSLQTLRSWHGPRHLQPWQSVRRHWSQ